MRWSELVFEGYSPQLRRTMSKTESMIHAMGSLHEADGYSNRSPVPEGKVARCECPNSECISLQFVYEIVGVRGSMCRAPAFFVPRNIDGDVCPHRVEDGREALKAQASSEEGGHRIELGKTAQIKAWLKKHLLQLQSSERYGYAAIAILYDRDLPLTMEQLCDLGEEMVRRFEEEKPYQTLVSKPC